MSTKKFNIHAIPTNIITGFLGVGKTSTILQLLNHKPKQERWAVLINEFGEIGVDGSLLANQQQEGSDVFIREVPGGCMCCAAGLPMQIALNHLLITAKPDRLLIEPTGLGHPKEIIETLSSEHYQEVLSLQKTLTLVDARDLSDERYTSHQTFNQQIAIADIVVGNKADLYNEQNRTALIEYTKKMAPHAHIIFASHGDIPQEILVGQTAMTLNPAHHHSHHDDTLLDDAPMPECGFIKAVNHGEGFESIGWRFSPEKTFDYDKLVAFVMNITADRMKAVFKTNNGPFGYNLNKGTLTELTLRECQDSRIEIISQQLDAQLESDLFACLVGND